MFVFFFFFFVYLSNKQLVNLVIMCQTWNLNFYLLKQFRASLSLKNHFVLLTVSKEFLFTKKKFFDLFSSSIHFWLNEWMNVGKKQNKKQQRKISKIDGRIWYFNNRLLAKTASFTNKKTHTHTSFSSSMNWISMMMMMWLHIEIPNQPTKKND